MNAEQKTCDISAGVCPKPPRTYGEPHYCELDDWHKSPWHLCPNCKMKWRADEVVAVYHRQPPQPQKQSWIRVVTSALRRAGVKG